MMLYQCLLMAAKRDCQECCLPHGYTDSVAKAYINDEGTLAALEMTSICGSSTTY